MSDWWQQAYPGGPMVIPAAYFPRPTYPPDAKTKGKTPSVDGPDVLAYKRTLCRLGRWGEWEPSKWDDAFSNGFSHGRSGNVIDSGVAGFQRQMRISDSGWIGQTTFNALASARIPKGLDNAGQPGMDANACNLITEAYALYGGKELLPPPPVTTTRERALQAAIGWLDYVEGANNDTVFGSWYGMNYQPWCAMFICYVHEVEAGGSPSFVRSSRYSYVPYIVDDAKAGRNGLSTVTTPQAGDLVCFDWQRDGVPDHVGIFESGTPAEFKCIEGNTSPSDNSNGGQVMRRTRSSSQGLLTFVRVAEP